MKRLLLLAAALVLGAGAAAAQNVSRPDCVIDITLTSAGQAAGGQGTCGNNINGVFEWRLNYKSVGFTALSLVIQSAPPDINGSCAAATWVAFAGTLVTGVNPNTATTQASTNVTGFYPCVRVSLTSVMGSGTITGQLYGCREPGCSIAGASINAVIAPIPLPVDGPTAEGLAPTTPPVLVAGQDGSPAIRTLKTDANGQLIPANSSSADADAVSNTEETQTGAAGGILYPRVFNRVFNGTTWDRMRGTAAGLFAQGPVADGVASTANPLVVGGVDQTGVARHFSTSPAGDIAVGSQSAAADGQANNWNFLVGGNGSTTAPLAVYLAKFNGATWDRDFVCPLSAPITVSAATDVVIIAGVAATNVRICNISFSGPTTVDATIRQGTGTTCGTNTATLAGTYGSITSLALDFQPAGALRTTVAARDVCLHFSASVTVGGVVVYAQF